MSLKPFLITAGALILLAGCKPKPIDIEVPQKPGTMAISSACYNEHTVYVSAGYSINSLKKLLDTSSAKELLNIPQEMLVDSGLVTIRRYGAEPDTLRKISRGLYGRKDLQLVPGAEYTLLVADHRKGITATATTTYLPQPAVDTLYPELVKNGQSKAVKLRLRLSNVVPGEHYIVSYNTTQHMRETATPLPYNAGALYSFMPKQLELFTADAVVNGVLDKSITLQVAPTDTVFVLLGSIDKAYYNYLAAYKRTGALVNQMTSEPINLPSNIITGLGFFSLYQPIRQVYDLNKF